MNISVKINVDGNVTALEGLHSWDELKEAIDYLYYKLGLRQKVGVTEKRLEDNRKRIGYWCKHPIVEIDGEAYSVDSYDRSRHGWYCYKMHPVGGDEHGYVWTVEDDFTYVFDADGKLIEKWEGWIWRQNIGQSKQ